tara:strand:- start:388 stop:600 length:213 start_codon:yes stop_codon:yes gene_type:complete
MGGGLNEMKLIEKNRKASGNCKCCGDYKMNSMWYKWYSLMTGELLFDMICKKCAKRELGNKRKDLHERLL